MHYVAAPEFQQVGSLEHDIAHRARPSAHSEVGWYCMLCAVYKQRLPLLHRKSRCILQAASLGFHLQNLSVLDAQRRSKRSCAVLPVTGASYPAQDTHHQPVCTASLTHTRRVSTSCAPCRISCGARKEEPQGVFLTFPPCRIRTLWARPGALRGGDMHDAGGGGSSPPSPFQSRARIPAHTSCQSARTRRSR